MKLDFSQINILLIGDFMVDHYFFGTSHRLSPEAPIPVVSLKEEVITPGGAGNVAMNLKSLGVNVTCVGCVGDDFFGKKLINIFKKNDINIEKIEILKDYKTTTKQRVYCDSKQQSRLDSEDLLLDWAPREEINHDKFDLIILSDYNKGVFSSKWFDPGDKDVVLDPKKLNKDIFKKSSIITPNISELSYLTNLDLKNQNMIVKAAHSLLKKYELKYVITTLGDKGMIIVDGQGLVESISSHDVKNPDVTGAGDTVLAIFSSIYALSKDVIFSAKVANLGASMVVAEKGTSQINLKNLETLVLSKIL